MVSMQKRRSLQLFLLQLLATFVLWGVVLAVAAHRNSFSISAPLIEILIVLAVLYLVTRVVRHFLRHRPQSGMLSALLAGVIVAGMLLIGPWLLDFIIRLTI